MATPRPSTAANRRPWLVALALALMAWALLAREGGAPPAPRLEDASRLRPGRAVALHEAPRP